MNRNISWKAGATIGTVVFAFATGHQMQASQNTTTQTPAAAQQVTVTGCVTREADYRKSVDAGRGGAVGTGAGTGNEFVLSNATMGTASGSSTTAGSSTSTGSSTAAGSSTATTGAGAASATGTAGRAASSAYELTGANEGKAQAFVGKRVEITGMLKAGDTAAGGTTGGPTGNV